MKCPELRWVMNGDVQLAVECWGSGTIPILFAHGWISSRRIWYECLVRLDPERYRLYLFDFRGCGASDRPKQGHDLEGYLSDLAAVAQFIGRPFLLVGHSMGGRIAQRFAVEKRVDIAGLLLIAPATAQGMAGVPRQRQLAELAFGSRRRITSFQHGAMRREVSREAQERLVEDALFAQRRHWFGWYDVGRVGDFSARLAELDLPTIVLLAQEDPVLPLTRAQREVVALIRGAQSIVLPECGHNIPIEAPQSVVEVIDRFADQHFLGE